MNAIGKKFTNSQGKEAIATKIIQKKPGNYIYEIKFIDSGCIRSVVYSSLARGSFKDYGSPSVYGVGYTYKGAKTSSRIYKTWMGMLERCYSEKFKSYPIYGGRGVKVSDRWLHFKNFEEDIKDLPGYNDFIKSNISWSYALDKDIRGDGLLYSKENCMFANYTQQSNARSVVKPIKCIFPNGEEKFYPSITKAVESLGVQNANVYKVLNGKRKHTQGYSFERLNAGTF